MCILASCGNFKFHQKLSALSFQIFFLKISSIFVMMPFLLLYILLVSFPSFVTYFRGLYLQCFSKSQILALLYFSVGFSILLLWSFSSLFLDCSCYFPSWLVGCFFLLWFWWLFSNRCI